MQISFFFITSLQETLKDFPQFQLQVLIIIYIFI